MLSKPPARRPWYFAVPLLMLLCATEAQAQARQVVLNEIAWMGNLSSANSEWMELFNNTASPINLTGWTLVATDGTPSITLAGILLG